ncbi:uncharacterized protein LACBIDRAFT_328667 [Laccaria bicolor S238N-H82]|uniref:Predicted protein n=1 Tax=Laccaria bicolor (strain S238N-H82 / ATCC MYA-4686) TaxID=486041 RepID=B0DFM0_LACBS|nr:uncharacterized protein LACBIDRAFT_328667 [Laccaria bicolor S238N-H82]EDR06891.1 predicted protein [Laccaria bicolor S238N-H82]|eukprot:XP_001882738.1 predicted protein [Laccaria bicolor S238N-H82]
MATQKSRLSSLDGQGGLDNREGSDPVVSTLPAPDGISHFKSKSLEQRQSIASVRPSYFVLYLHHLTCSGKVYYRLYTEDGPLETYNPVYSDDIFISRISSKSIAPPRTAASLKKYLCKIEGYQIEPGKFNLYLSLGEKTPVEDSIRLALKGNSGAGSSGFDPVALIIGVKEKRMKAPDMVNVKELDQWPEKEARRYVYYRVYDEDGEAPSKMSFDHSEPCLGRIDALAVPPPHTVSSLKCCLIQVEKYVDCELQLFEEDDGETMMNDSDTIALHADTYFPALVYKRIPQPFSKKVRAKAFCKYPCYVATNTAGKKAFLQGVIHKDHLRRPLGKKLEIAQRIDISLKVHNCPGEHGKAAASCAAILKVKSSYEARSESVMDLLKVPPILVRLEVRSTFGYIA